MTTVTGDKSTRYIFPDDAIVLSNATRIACTRAGATSPRERESIADSVLWLARCGYARHSDGTLDAGVLAEAALAVGGISSLAGRLPPAPAEIAAAF